tara:strand:- start:198 stop:467 length:270 start_codon:yes stop_codon:yes gene_type:complete
MPIYVYFCEKCEKELKALHSVKEKYTACQEIEDCKNKGNLTRIPSNFSSQYVKQEQEQKVGALVEDFIEETRDELKNEKKILRNQEYRE